MEWFVNAAKPSPAWRSTSSPRPSPPMNTRPARWPRAFSEITGIKLKHDLIQEGDVVEKLQTQMQSGRNVYDGWINDSDLIGTHFRYKQTTNLTDWMAGRGQGRHQSAARCRRLHRQVLRHRARTSKLYQLPDQQFANLYWFRYDWFTRPDLTGDVQRQVRLRARRARELVGL